MQFQYNTRSREYQPTRQQRRALQKQNSKSSPRSARSLCAGKAAENTLIKQLPSRFHVAYEGLLSSMFQSVFDEYGLVAFESPRETAAWHESGHCVVGAALGMGIRSAHIERDYDNLFSEFWSGHCYWRGDLMVGNAVPAEENARAAALYIAGLMSEKLFDRQLPGSSLDEQATVMIIASIASDNPMRAASAYWGLAERILVAHAETVRAVAEALLQHERLSEEKLKDLLHRVVAGVAH